MLDIKRSVDRIGIDDCHAPSRRIVRHFESRVKVFKKVCTVNPRYGQVVGLNTTRVGQKIAERFHLSRS